MIVTRHLRSSAVDFFFGGAFIPSHSACHGGYKGPMFLLCSRAGVTVANDPKSKTTFNFRVDRWDSAGESIFDNVGGSDDFLCAVKLYEAARRRWPGERVTLRQGARIVHKSWRDDA